MKDPFVDIAEQPMSRTDSTVAAQETTASPEQVRKLLSNRHVCPYCGHQNSGGSEACVHCTMEDSPATRQATKARIGPWYVLQSRNPSAPGMRFSTLVSLLRKGYITPKSVVRGPTTHQLWRFAAHVRGVSREFGLCYSCGASIIKTASFCPTCQRPQEPPAEPDVLLEPRHNGHKPSVPVIDPIQEPVAQTMQANVPVPVPAHAPTEPPQELEQAPSSYARRLRELNRRKDAEETARQNKLPARRSTQPVFSGDPQTVSAMSLAQALRSDPSDDMLVPSRRRLKVLLAAAAIVIVGASALLWFRPDYRETSLRFAQDTWARISTTVSEIEWPTVTTAPPPRETPASLEPRTSPPPLRYEIEAPPTQPALAEAEPPASSPSVQPIAQAPPVVEPEPAPDPEQFIQKVRALWTQAINAEAEQDFASAVRFYEQIRELPRDVWPGGLQINLDRVRNRLQSTSAQ